jgi:hypothetical protein
MIYLSYCESDQSIVRDATAASACTLSNSLYRPNDVCLTFTLIAPHFGFSEYSALLFKAHW